MISLGSDKQRQDNIEKVILITYIVYLVLDHALTVGISIYYIKKFRKEMSETFIDLHKIVQYTILL